MYKMVSNIEYNSFIVKYTRQFNTKFITLIINIYLEHSFLYEENFLKSLSDVLNIKNTCGYITCVTTPTKYEKKFISEHPSG